MYLICCDLAELAAVRTTKPSILFADAPSQFLVYGARMIFF